MKVSREKAALGFFVVLSLAALAVLVAYIIGASRSLNVAASSIDDATGNLEGYTALIWEGQGSDRSEALVGKTARDHLVSRSIFSQADQQSDTTNSEEVSAADVANDTDDSDERDSVSVFAVQNSYLDKQAHVIVLDVAHPLVYNERTIVRAGKYTFGMIWIDSVSAQQTYLHKRVNDYRKRDVDFVVCLTSDVALLEEYDGVDIVLSTQNEGFAAHGVLSQGVFYDDAALVGQVGTILISPSRTISAKDVSSI